MLQHLHLYLIVIIHQREYNVDLLSRLTKLRLQNYIFQKVTKMGPITGQTRTRLKWWRGSERPAAHTQQTLSQVPPPLPLGVRMTDPGSLASKEWMNPCTEWIIQFLWCTKIRVILDLSTWSQSSQRNAPLPVYNVIIRYTSTSNIPVPQQHHRVWKENMKMASLLKACSCTSYL